MVSFNQKQLSYALNRTRMVKPWRKILYEKQDYPDNYVDKDQFLNGLRKNLHTETYELREVILESGVVAQEISSVCIFVAVYWWVQEGWLSPLSLLFLCLLLSSAGLTASFLTWSNSREMRGLLNTYILPSAFFTLFLCVVSPILKTLTEAISTDTLWAMTVGMLLTHLMFFNYGSDGAMVSGAISLNAAIFAAVCLASRLPSSFHAFVLISFAVIIFALFPKFRERWNLQYTYSLALTTVTIGILTAAILATLSISVALIFLLCVLSVTFVCPLLFVKLQHLKNNIYGPWDEAVIHL